MGTAVLSRPTLYLCRSSGDRWSSADQVTACTTCSFTSAFLPPCYSSDIAFLVNHLTHKAILILFTDCPPHKTLKASPAPLAHRQCWHSTVCIYAVGHFRFSSIPCEQNYCVCCPQRTRPESGRVLLFFPQTPFEICPEGTAEFQNLSYNLLNST